jgi:hypothetical protein
LDFVLPCILGSGSSASLVLTLLVTAIALLLLLLLLRHRRDAATQGTGTEKLLLKGREEF